MKLWHAKHNESGDVRAAASETDLRAKILASGRGSPWTITYGETPTDKASVLALIEDNSNPVAKVEARAIFEVREGKVVKVRESKK